MFLKMTKFAEGRRQSHQIILLKDGGALRFDLGQPQEVDDKVGHQILADHDNFKIEEKKKKTRKPREVEGTTKQVSEDQVTVS